MRNINKFPFKPIKKLSSKLAPFKGSPYIERTLHSGSIDELISETSFKSYGKLPNLSYKGINFNEPLPSNPPHINPKGLNYSLRVNYLEGSSDYFTITSIEEGLSYVLYNVEKVKTVSDLSQAVSSAGGDTSGVMRVSLGWGPAVDVDLHIIEPDGGEEIYYSNKTSITSGVLDVDAQITANAVENVTWTNEEAILEGVYTVRAFGYNISTPVDNFVVEVAYKDSLYLFNVDSSISTGQTIDVLKFNLSKEEGLTIIDPIVEPIVASSSSGIDLGLEEGEEVPEGISFDILMPVDDGVRYIGDVGEVTGSSITFLENRRSIEGLSLVTEDSTFDAVFVKDNQVYIRKIESLSYSDLSSSVSITLESMFDPPPIEGDLVYIKSSLWSSFCNPMPDAKVPLSSEHFDIDNEDFVQSPMFDYELDHSSGSFKWYGNWLKGISSNSFIETNSSFGSSTSGFSLSVENTSITSEITEESYTLILNTSIQNVSVTNGTLGSLKVNLSGLGGTFDLDYLGVVSTFNPDEDFILSDLPYGPNFVTITPSLTGEVIRLNIFVGDSTGLSSLEFFSSTYDFLNQSVDSYSTPLSFTKEGVYPTVPPVLEASFEVTPTQGGNYLLSVNNDTDIFTASSSTIGFSQLPLGFNRLNIVEESTGVVGHIGFFFGDTLDKSSYILSNSQWGYEELSFNSGRVSTQVDLSYSGSSLDTFSDLGYYSSSNPQIPYNSELKASGVIISSSSNLSPEEVQELIGGGATDSHEHDDLYYTNEELDSYLDTNLISSVNHDSDLQNIGTLSSYSNPEILHVSKTDLDGWKEMAVKAKDLLQVVSDPNFNPDEEQVPTTASEFGVFRDAGCTIPLEAEGFHLVETPTENTLFITTATNDSVKGDLGFVYVKMPFAGIPLSYGMKSGGAGNWGGGALRLQNVRGNPVGLTIGGSSAIFQGEYLNDLVFEALGVPADYYPDNTLEELSYLKHWYQTSDLGDFTSTSSVLKIRVGFGGKGAAGAEGSNGSYGYGGFPGGVASGISVDAEGLPLEISPWKVVNQTITPYSTATSYVVGKDGVEDNLTYPETGDSGDGGGTQTTPLGPVDRLLDIENTFSTKDLSGFGVSGDPGSTAPAEFYGGGQGGGGGSCGIVYLSWDPNFPNPSSNPPLEDVPDIDSVFFGNMYETEDPNIYACITHNGVCSLDLSDYTSPTILSYLTIDTSSFSSGSLPVSSAGVYHFNNKRFVFLAEDRIISIDFWDKNRLKLNFNSYSGGLAFGAVGNPETGTLYAYRNSEVRQYTSQGASFTGETVYNLSSQNLIASRTHGDLDSMVLIGDYLYVSDFGDESLYTPVGKLLKININTKGVSEVPLPQGFNNLGKMRLGNLGGNKLLVFDPRKLNYEDLGVGMVLDVSNPSSISEIEVKANFVNLLVKDAFMGYTVVFSRDLNNALITNAPNHGVKVENLSGALPIYLGTLMYSQTSTQGAVTTLAYTDENRMWQVIQPEGYFQNLDPIKGVLENHSVVI